MSRLRSSDCDRWSLPGTRMKGTVVRIYLNKGYCFVRGEDRISRFAHASDFAKQEEFDVLREGQAVRFVPVVTEKGPRATKLVMC